MTRVVSVLVVLGGSLVRVAALVARVRGAMIPVVSVLVVLGGSLVRVAALEARVRGVMIPVVSVLVVLGGSQARVAALVARVRGATTLAASADRAIAPSRKVVRGRLAPAAVVVEMMIAAVLALAIARRALANLAAAAAPGTTTARRARALAAAIALDVTEVDPRPAGMTARADRRDRATAQATTPVLRRADHHAHRKIVALTAIALVLAAIDQTRIALRSAEGRVNPSLDLPGNHAGSHAHLAWNSLRISIFNNFRAACAPSCAA